MNGKQSKWALNELTLWLANRGWTIKFRPRCKDEAWFDTKQMTISLDATAEHRIFTILHECGHIIAGGKRAVYELVYTSTAKKKTDWYKILRVVNEVRAWDAGERLATRLGIFIDRNGYAAYRARYLKKYMRWAITSPKKKNR